MRIRSGGRALGALTFFFVAMTLAAFPLAAQETGTDAPHHTWSSVYQLDNPVGRQVNLVILALFGLALIDAVWSLIRVLHDGRVLAQARKAFTGGIEAAISNPEDCLKALGLDAAERGSLVAERVHALFKLRMHRGIDMSALMQMAGDQVGSRAAFARFVAGSLVVVGLVGTVFGLSLAVRDLAPLVSSVDSAKAITVFGGQMLKTLAAMQTAFSCTLTGLICALVLSLVVFVVQRKQMGLHQALESFSYFELVPAIVPPASDQATQEFVHTIGNARETVVRSIDQVERLAGRLEAGADSINKTADELRNVSRAADSLDGAANRFAAVSSDIATRNAEQAQTWKTVIDGLSGAVGTLESQVTQLASAAGALQEATGALKDLRALPENLQGVLGRAMAGAVEFAQKKQEDYTKAHILSLQQFHQSYVDLVRGVQDAVAEAIATGMARAMPPAPKGGIGPDGAARARSN